MLKKTKELLDKIIKALFITPKPDLILYTITLFLIIFFIWATKSELEEVTRGNGKVIASSKVQVIQNLEGGIVRSIAVRTGQKVQEGELLINSPSNFVGYLNENADTDWVQTGDLGYYKTFKNKKYWFLRSRIKEIIKYRDQTLYPQDIEQWVQDQLNLPISSLAPGKNTNTSG